MTVAHGSIILIAEKHKSMEDNIKKDDNTIASEPTELEKLKAERDEYLNGWKRAKADLLNYQKDESKRFEEMAKFATEDILKEIISVIDHLTLAFGSIEKSGGQVDQGLLLIKNQLFDVIKKRGIRKIEIRPGEEYNPMYHEAIEMVEPGSGQPNLKSGTIAEEVEPGYALHNYVLKPARVKVVA